MKLVRLVVAFGGALLLLYLGGIRFWNVVVAASLPGDARINPNAESGTVFAQWLLTGLVALALLIAGVVQAFQPEPKTDL